MKQHIAMRLVIACFIACAIASVATATTDRERVLRIDAVELIDRAKEVEGSIELKHQHGRYTYLFANAANVETFKTNLAKYEIQFDGACGRMGPLSGEGSPKLFAAHAGRLYLFASEQCKRAFLKHPSKFLETDDEPLVTSEQSLARGRALIERAAKAIGGGDSSRLDSLKSYREKRSRETESGETKYVVADTLTLLPPDGVAIAQCWNDSCFGTVATATDSWATGSQGAVPMVESQRIALLRSAGRHPLTLLRNRNASGVVMTSNGDTRSVTVPGEGAVNVELALMHVAGATTTLGIDDKGFVRWMSYRGRGPNSTVGVIERTYIGYQDVSGLKLPGRVDVTFDGQSSPEESGAFAEQSINESSHLAAFQR